MDTAPCKATVLTLRDTPKGYEILIAAQKLAKRFRRRCARLSRRCTWTRADAEAHDLVVRTRRRYGVPPRLEVERGGLAFYVASLRELFEEAGLLLAEISTVMSSRSRLPGAVEAAGPRFVARSTPANSGVSRSPTRERDYDPDLRRRRVPRALDNPGGPRPGDTTRDSSWRPGHPRGQVATHDAGETVADYLGADRWTALAPRERRGEFEMISTDHQGTWGRWRTSVKNPKRCWRTRGGQWSRLPCVDRAFITRDGEVVFVRTP